MSVASILLSLSAAPSIYLSFHSPSRFCTPVGCIALHDPKLLRRPLTLSLSRERVYVTRGESKAYCSVLPVALPHLLSPPLSRSMSFPAALGRPRFPRDGSAFQADTTFIVCYCSARDRHCMTALLEDGMEGWGGEVAREFHVTVPGVRFCTVGRLFGAAQPTVAIMCACRQPGRDRSSPCPSVRVVQHGKVCTL
jgi:hypothetical protein